MLFTGRWESPVPPGPGCVRVCSRLGGNPTRFGSFPRAVLQNRCSSATAPGMRLEIRKPATNGGSGGGRLTDDGNIEMGFALGAGADIKGLPD